MKIAVPVHSDKETIFKRTGQAPFFAIFQDGVLESFIENTHTKEEHNHHEHSEDDEEHVGHHKKDIAGLAGCDIILVQMVGEQMREAIESLNIKIKKIREKDGHIASEAVKNFLLKQEEISE